MTAQQPFWTRSRGLTSVVTALAVTGSLFIASAPAAQAEETTTAAETRTTNTPETTANAGLPTDAGITMPEKSNETTGDILGLGYEQRITLEKIPEGKTEVKIFEPASRGGGLLKSFPTKISVTGWPKSGITAQNPFFGGKAINDAEIPANRIAVAPDNKSIYVTEVRGKLVGNNGTMAPDGSYIFRYSPDGAFLNEKKFDGNAGITALDAAGGSLAVGLNRYGVRILDANTLQETHTIYGTWSGSGLWNGDMVSAVKFGVDSSGRRVIAVSKFTYNDNALYVADVETGNTVRTANYRKQSDKWEWAQSITFGRFGTDNEPAFAVGWAGPTSNNKATIYAASNDSELGSQNGDASVTALRLFTNADGKNVLGVVWGENGKLIGSNSAGGLETLAETTSTDLVKRSVPGYRSLVLSVSNQAREKVQFQSFSGPSPAKGCWLNRELVGGSPIPAGPVPISAGGVSSSFGVGQATAGDCGSAGVFFGDVSLPDGSGRQLVKVVVDGNTPRIVEQGGNGRFVFDITPAGVGGLLGAWTLTVREQNTGDLMVQAPPTVTGERLTPAAAEGWKPTDQIDDPSRPVYRFTVSGPQWRVPGADAGLTETVLPGMQAEGSVDGSTWVSLGALVPGTAPSRNGQYVTLGDATFDWQTSNAPSAPDYKHFRVSAGDEALYGDTSSVPVNVDTLSAPAEFTQVQSIKISSATQSVRPNGVDEITSRFSLVDKNATVLDPGAYETLYDRVYFRDGVTKALLTGLNDPANPGQQVAVSPLRGMFANDGTQLMGADSRNIYVSATNPSAKPPVATFKPTGSATTTVTATFFQGQPFILDRSTLTAEGTGASGFQIGNCAEGACTIGSPTPTTPTLFAAGEDKIGLQLRTQAVTGSSSLPLGDANTPAEKHALGFNGLDIRTNKAYLSDPNAFGFNGTFTTTVITHGERLHPNNIIVKAKE
jgi:hypothetical protein